MMDDLGDDAILPLFSQSDPYSPVHSFNAFGDEQGSRASASAPRKALDLSAESEEWPHLAENQGYLQSGRGGGTSGGGSGGGGSGSSGGLPPHLSRDGRGGGNRMLGLRTARGRGRVRPRDAESMDNEDVQEVAAMTQCTVKQMELGNYNKRTMTAGGYKMIEERYRVATNLHHDRKQFANRIRQLKGLFTFIKQMHTDSGLGRDEKGWPIATADWWDRNTKGHSDWKKLKYGPPDYLSLLEQIFEGVAIDGSTSFVAGQHNVKKIIRSLMMMCMKYLSKVL